MNCEYQVGPAALAVVGALVFWVQVPAFADDPQHLAVERGCTFCHSPEPSKAVGGAVPPTGPAWSDISRRYRGQPGAEDRLTAIVGGGSDPGKRHWARTSGVVMPSNQILISEDEARMLVRWILRRNAP